MLYCPRSSVSQDDQDDKISLSKRELKTLLAQQHFRSIKHNNHDKVATTKFYSIKAMSNAQPEQLEAEGDRKEVFPLVTQ
jgi:hypothetical protein